MCEEALFLDSRHLISIGIIVMLLVRFEKIGRNKVLLSFCSEYSIEVMILKGLVN